MSSLGEAKGTASTGRSLLTRRSGLWLVLVIALLTHLPTPFLVFATDDYMIRAMVAGDAQLFAQGFTKANPAKGFWQQINDGFHFYNTNTDTRDFYQQYGNLTWWAGDHSKMNPWRPLSAFTHWLDARIAPESFAFQVFHSLLYVLLLALCSYRLFWRLMPEPVVAVLASLFITVDISNLMSFGWISARNVFIATALGCFALEQFLAWREQQRWQPLVFSLLAFLLALFSAENSISILAYMGAYLLCIERGSLLRRGVLLFPYLALMVVWRLGYDALGYGAVGIGLYVDPGHDLGAFLYSLATVLPIVLAGLMTGVDGALQALAPEMRIWVTVLSAVLVLVCLPLLGSLLRQDPRVRFMLLGCVLAAVPGCAQISVGFRAGIFASIGFFWLLSLWVKQLAGQQRWWLRRGVVGGVLFYHLIVPALAGFALTSHLVPVNYTDNGRFSSVANVYQAGSAAPPLVLVNSPAPNLEFYLPFEWRYQYGVIPAALNVMAPGLVTIDLKRLSEREFELSAPAGLPLHHLHQVYDLQGQHPFLSSAYNAQMLQGLMSTPRDQVQVGDVRHAGNMRVTILALKEDRPSRLRIEFVGAVAPDAMAWEYYDYQTRLFKALPVLAVGEQVRIPGPFDVAAGALMGVCFNCEAGDSTPRSESPAAQLRVR